MSAFTFIGMAIATHPSPRPEARRTFSVATVETSTMSGPTLYACCGPPLSGIGTMECSFVSQNEQREGAKCTQWEKAMYGNLWGDPAAHKRGWFEVGESDGGRIRFEDCDMTHFACDDNVENCTTNNPDQGKDWAATCGTMKAFDRNGDMVEESVTTGLPAAEGFRIVHDRRYGQIYGTDVYQQLTTPTRANAGEQVYPLDVQVTGLIFAGTARPRAGQ